MSAGAAIAVVKNAHLWARHPEDFYVEPEWVSRRLFDVEEFNGSVYDPACGLGRIMRSASKAGLYAFGTDIVARSPACSFTRNFLTSGIDVVNYNIVSNPPFGVADNFAKCALASTAPKVALLLPTKWMNGAARGKWLETTPLKCVWLLAPRPSMPPGTVIQAGEKPGNGTVDFAWYVYERGYTGRPELRWLRRDG